MLSSNRANPAGQSNESETARTVALQHGMLMSRALIGVGSSSPKIHENMPAFSSPSRGSRPPHREQITALVLTPLSINMTRSYVSISASSPSGKALTNTFNASRWHDSGGTNSGSAGMNLRTSSDIGPPNVPGDKRRAQARPLHRQV